MCVGSCYTSNFGFWVSPLFDPRRFLGAAQNKIIVKKIRFFWLIHQDFFWVYFIACVNSQFCVWVFALCLCILFTYWKEYSFTRVRSTYILCSSVPLVGLRGAGYVGVVDMRVKKIFSELTQHLKNCSQF